MSLLDRECDNCGTMCELDQMEGQDGRILCRDCIGAKEHERV